MRMDVKLVFFVLLHTVVLLEANPNLSVERFFAFLTKTIIDYLYPKDPNITRVRYPNETQTEGNNIKILDFIGLVQRFGYPAEEHYVTTEDGYNLVIHRIPGSPSSSNSQQKKKVVFIQHGMVCTSDNFVIIGPGVDIPFLLADKGYDVWLGNARGNSYSRSHVKLSPRDKDFWQFSYHEIGTRDLPVVIDYVLNYTKQKTLRYVGVSMGTTALFVLLSTKPEYNEKIKLGILLAPFAIWKEMHPLALGYIQDIVPMLKEFFDSNDVSELYSLSSTTITIGRTLCADKTITQSLCIALIFLLGGSDPAQFNTTAFPEILTYGPAGTNVQTLYHYLQNGITHKFQSYDYGYFGNYKHYGQATPIKYDLKKVTAPLALFYGANDRMALKSNVLETSRHLPNVILLEENPYKLFTHFDFMWAIDIKALLHDRVLEILQKHDKRQSMI